MSALSRSLPRAPLRRGLYGLALALSAALLAGNAAAAPNFPFGSHRQPYAAGTLNPSVGRAAADQSTASFYRTWKQRHLKPGCKAGEYRVVANTDDAYVVSEGQGYGMLITVMMAGSDAEAQTLFDGLHRYNRNHRSEIDSDLTAWAQDASCRNVGGTASATDGDLDMAYALLLADRQWGSAGSVNYLAEARRTIAAIRRSNIHPTSKLTHLGDWVDSGSPVRYNGSRSSDWMMGHFRAFASRLGDSYWTGVLDAHQAALADMQSRHAPNTGLLPDFVVDTHTRARPAPAEFLEGAYDGYYSWNAGRVPWRIGIDAAASGDARSRTAARKLSQWIRSKTGNDPARVRSGYKLDGSVVENYNSMFFTAPFAVAATVDPDGQAWLDRLWNHMATSSAGDYYGDSVRLLSMLAVSNNWLRP
ncbi:glycosyl hydrolase family 8 [Lysobacter antibioticus]|uniref:glycosyl hydrolase family 8 n=1 Tax=Lysobacter antibioticus TaxID=84531 RepID=UPI00034A0023|nr:glycosyl hydrolase family 8 [Lysobacter antibioticus]